MCCVLTDEHAVDEPIDALFELSELTSPVVGLVNHDQQVQRLRTQS